MIRRFLISTKAKPALCVRCQELVLIAMVSGVRTRVDPYAIEPPVEAIAIIAGRQTYTLYLGELYARLGGTFALRGPVLPAHICHSPLSGPPHACPDADCSRTCSADSQPPF